MLSRTSRNNDVSIDLLCTRDLTRFKRSVLLDPKAVEKFPDYRLKPEVHWFWLSLEGRDN
jgi:hypothetical protein